MNKKSLKALHKNPDSKYVTEKMSVTPARLAKLEARRQRIHAANGGAAPESLPEQSDMITYVSGERLTETKVGKRKVVMREMQTQIRCKTIVKDKDGKDKKKRFVLFDRKSYTPEMLANLAREMKAGNKVDNDVKRGVIHNVPEETKIRPVIAGSRKSR